MNRPARQTLVKPSDNPFRSGCMDALDYVSPSGETWSHIEARVRAAGFRGALVGPQGHGKSTLMAKLAAIDPPADAAHHPVFKVLADGSNRDEFKTMMRNRAGPLFVDGYDLLPWRQRRALRARAQVVVTSHRVSRLPTLLRCETTPGLLGELVGRLSPAAHGALGDARIAELHERHGGNVRNALRELYDRVAGGEFKI